MSRYPNADVERFDQQFAESEDERNARLATKRAAASGMFRDHSCWKCKDGTRACVAGNPRQEEALRMTDAKSEAAALLEGLVEQAAEAIHSVDSSTEYSWQEVMRVPKYVEHRRQQARAALLSAPVKAAVAVLMEERDKLALSRNAWQDSARIALARAEAAESERAALMEERNQLEANHRVSSEGNKMLLAERAALLRRIEDAEREPVLPCDVTLGNCTFRKGVKISVLQGKLTRMHERYAGLARHWAERSMTPLPSIEDIDNED